MQRMSLRFYTSTKTGALMSRLDNDVLGAQRAVTSTLVTIVTSVFQVVVILVIMLSLEWRLTIVSLIVIPLFYVPSRRVAQALRELVHQQYDLDANLEARMNETLNVSGALLVKLFGKQREEIERFNGIADQLAAIGVRQAITGRWFFMALGLITAIGAAVVTGAAGSW